jgi:predicted nucleic acid-binding protein
MERVPPWLGGWAILVIRRNLLHKMSIPPYPAIEETSANAGDVVLDTSVLMDCFFLDRPEHAQAVELARVLEKAGSTVFIPAHYYFELVSAVLCENRVRKQALALGEFKLELPLKTFIVTIDERFVINYLIRPAMSGKVIDLKGGDMIFAAIALGLEIPLITEDRKVRSKVRQLGARAFTVREYLTETEA